MVKRREIQLVGVLLNSYDTPSIADDASVSRPFYRFSNRRITQH